MQCVKKKEFGVVRIEKFEEYLFLEGQSMRRLNGEKKVKCLNDKSIFAGMGFLWCNLDLF